MVRCYLKVEELSMVFRKPTTEKYQYSLKLMKSLRMLTLSWTFKVLWEIKIISLWFVWYRLFFVLVAFVFYVYCHLVTIEYKIFFFYFMYIYIKVTHDTKCNELLYELLFFLLCIISLSFHLFFLLKKNLFNSICLSIKKVLSVFWNDMYPWTNWMVVFGFYASFVVK